VQRYRWIDRQRTSQWIAQQSADRARAVIRARQLSVISAQQTDVMCALIFGVRAAQSPDCANRSSAHNIPTTINLTTQKVANMYTPNDAESTTSNWLFYVIRV